MIAKVSTCMPQQSCQGLRLQLHDSLGQFEGNLSALGCYVLPESQQKDGKQLTWPLFTYGIGGEERPQTDSRYGPS
ncbi:hypothetical protein EON65_18515 [archaeon]|nr:MAG: hypothetical protein EON65_18515 [archaeon]